MKNLYASIPYEIRNGKDYRVYKKFLERHIDIEAYEIMKLKETLLYAYENTVYYKKTFDMLQVDPRDINHRKDLEVFPLIDKDTVKENFDDMIVKNYSSNDTFYVSTGGSTSEPMKFLQSKNIWKKELAFDTVYLQKFGYTPMMPRASFRGGEFKNKNDHVYWNLNPMYNEVHFSPFHLSVDTVKYYAKKLDILHVEMYMSYPSSLLLLIDSLEAKNIVLDTHPKLILLISEGVNAHEVEKISNYFKYSKITSFYGHSERLILGVSDSGLLENYQIDRRYGLFELVDSEKNCIDANQQYGEIVGTSFDNWSMPIIRYKTGDFTEYNNVDKYTINHIDGRQNDYLIGYNGSKVFITGLTGHSKVFDNVRQYQFVQESIGEVKLLIIADQKFTAKDKKSILEAIHKRVGNNMKFSLKCVDQLIMTPRGKVKRVVRKDKTL